jgi:molybdopterin/thiamine biosynthesis adenylyltransferase
MTPASLIKPLIFPFSDQTRYQQIQLQYPHLNVVDTYSDQLHELFKSRYPAHAQNQVKQADFLHKLLHTSMPETTGNWVFFPWNHTLVHLLTENLFQEVRLSRNYPLISKRDQHKFLNLTIGVVGLSVGSSIVQTIVHSGGGHRLKLADFDSLSLSNLNRIRASVANLGENKTHILAKQVYEVNPYAHITLYENGIHPDNIRDFFQSDPPLDLVIDEADDITVKQYLRLTARSLRLPLIMTTDNGFESNTRILRFDQNQQAGGMAKVPDLSLQDIFDNFKNHSPAPLTEKQKLKLIAQLVGVNNISTEMQHGSMLRAQEKIAGWPQLAMTVFVGGSLAAYAAKLIAIGAKTYQQQSSFSITSHLRPSHHSPRSKQARQKRTRQFLDFLKTVE